MLPTPAGLHRARGQTTGAVSVLLSLLLTLTVPAPPAGAQSLPVLGGTWQRLSDPELARVDVADAVLLPSGEIAALTTVRETGGGAVCVAVFSPATFEWHRPELVGSGLEPDRCFLSEEQFVLGADSRLHSASRTIDLSVEPWTVEPSDLWSLASTEREVPIGIGSSGLVYLRDQLGGGTGFRMVEVDLETMSTRTTSAIEDFNRWIISDPADQILVIEYPEGSIARYDPTDDSWQDVSPDPPEFVYSPAAAIGPDGRTYVWDDVAAFPDIYAWDPKLGRWLSVPLPEDLNGDFWRPAFVGGADGLLYAMDDAQPYSFLPGAVQEPAAPTPVPSLPDTAMPPAVIGRPTLHPAALVLLGLATLTALIAASLNAARLGRRR